MAMALSQAMTRKVAGVEALRKPGFGWHAEDSPSLSRGF
jgi:hypothetical protein